MCNNNPKTISETIQEIRSGNLNPKLIDKETRKQCVEYLCSQGMTDTDIAEFFKVHDKTIKRDKALIRQENSINSDPRHTGIIAGIAFKELITSITNLRRHSRNKNAQISDKIEIEKTISSIVSDAIKNFQSLGIICQGSHNATTDKNDQFNNKADLNMLQDEISRLIGIEQKDLPIINAKIINNEDKNGSKGTPKC